MITGAITGKTGKGGNNGNKISHLYLVVTSDSIARKTG